MFSLRGCDVCRFRPQSLRTEKSCRMKGESNKAIAELFRSKPKRV